MIQTQGGRDRPVARFWAQLADRPEIVQPQNEWLRYLPAGLLARTGPGDSGRFRRRRSPDEYPFKERLLKERTLEERRL
jgi:hypothetical protein